MERHRASNRAKTNSQWIDPNRLLAIFLCGPILRLSLRQVAMLYSSREVRPQSDLKNGMKIESVHGIAFGS
jgi:hypothetical protein